MQVVGERVLPDPPQLTSPTTTQTTTPPDLTQEFIHRAAWRAGVMGALNVAVMILAVRLVVLVAVGGGIVLTWLALQEPDPMRLGALGIYAAVIVVPCIWLAGRR